MACAQALVEGEAFVELWGAFVKTRRSGMPAAPTFRANIPNTLPLLWRRSVWGREIGSAAAVIDTTLPYVSDGQRRLRE